MEHKYAELFTTPFYTPYGQEPLFFPVSGGAPIMTPSHNMLHVTMGGTITGQTASGLQDEGMKRTADDLFQLVGPTVAYLNRNRDVDINFKSEPLCDIDSSNILPQHWASLARLIHDRYDDFDWLAGIRQGKRKSRTRVPEGIGSMRNHE